ncbi:MAG: hypothetical protein Q8M94_04490, partial [Ignavibacteria bacterium]|nr:hypothetical protein [Ignavibacteria bacterium]
MSKENIVKLHYSSFLTEGYLEDLKSLMFFNQNQHKVMPGILESIERYGLPHLNIQNGMIRVTVGKITDVQTIFVLDHTGSTNELIGVIVFFRESRDNITLLHIA